MIDVPVYPRCTVLSIVDDEARVVPVEREGPFARASMVDCPKSLTDMLVPSGPCPSWPSFLQEDSVCSAINRIGKNNAILLLSFMFNQLLVTN